MHTLVNCAGFGKIGEYSDISPETNHAMIDLNCKALVDITLSVLPYMRRGSRILQICSSSAFQPLPGLNIYAATKSFVLQYSRALRWELRGRGIGVTAVCPYWIKDTEFIPLAESVEAGKPLTHYPLASKSKSVVRRSLRASRYNLPVSTPGLICTLQRIINKIIPKEIFIAVWQLMRRVR